MFEVNKNEIRKGKSQQSPTKNNLILLSKNESKYTQSIKKNYNVVDFIKNKKRFILENSFDIKGTREFLASKEVAMRVIKLNDEIIEEDKKNDDDSDNRDIYNTNICNGIVKLKKNVKKKITPIQLKDKFKSNKELFLDMDLKKIKKELKKIKDGLDVEETTDKKKKIKNKKSKKNQKDSPKGKVGCISPKKYFSGNVIKIYSSPRKKQNTNTINPTHNINQEQSQFLFSEINKKLMADDSLNLSGIDEKNMSPKIIPKNKLKDEVYYSDINYNKSKNIFKNKINEEIFEEDKSQNPGNEVIGIQINSDKESLISILSELL